MADVDYFKLYNDYNGHLAGDLALSEIARIFSAVTRQEDIVARYGGEEFAVIMPGLDETQAYIVATNLNRAVFSYRFNGEQKLPGHRLTLSAGVAAVSPEVKDSFQLIQLADTALYQAKAEGRNCVISSNQIEAKEIK
jgi:diguanylate cyclase (GGDEF)-like protein